MLTSGGGRKTEILAKQVKFRIIATGVGTEDMTLRRVTKEKRDEATPRGRGRDTPTFIPASGAAIT